MYEVCKNFKVPPLYFLLVQINTPELHRTRVHHSLSKAGIDQAYAVLAMFFS